MNWASVILICWFAVGFLIELVALVCSQKDAPVVAGRLVGYIIKLGLLTTLIHYSGGWQ